MLIGERLRELREAKKFSQGDIEKRTGMLRCYTSRVENGHTVPALETLEKYARALEIPLYRLFYEGDEPPKLPKSLASDSDWGAKGKEATELRTLARLLSRMSKQDQNLLLTMAQRMAPRRRRK
jgi:transcriptional regulator with XRE-family HTH domain